MRRVEIDPENISANNIINGYSDFTRSQIKHRLAEGKISKSEADALLS